MRKLFLLVICCFPLTSCMTSHLINWVQDEDSLYGEPDEGYAKGMVKPFFAFVGAPILFGLDLATFPIQAVAGVYPFSDAFMTPEQVGSKPDDSDHDD